MSKMKTIPANSPLTEVELDRLEEFLRIRRETYKDTMGLEELDGFLTALVINPEMVMPHDYLPDIFGEGIDAFETDEEAEEVLVLIFRHFNTIAAKLEKKEPYLPLFTEVEDGIPRGNNWAHGFLQGARWCYDAWREVMVDKQHGYGVPMLILDNEHNPKPELRPPPITPERREDLIVALGLATMLAYQHFEPQRREDAENFSDDGDLDDEVPLQMVRTEPKVGRNDPCHCGSGKKYKRCHGSVAVR